MGKEVILDKISFRKKVEQLSNLPTLPNLLDKFTRMLKDPKTSMAAFGKELSKDQMLTSKILKLVNSAFYGFPGRISTVTNALVLLGYDALKGLIISSNIFENLSPEAYPLWHHSVTVSLASRAIARELSLPDIEEFAVAGLLHDIGKVILHVEASEEYRTVINQAKKAKQPVWQTEGEILGFDPLYIANEGKVIIVAERKDADKIINKMRKNKYGRKAEIIGEVVGEPTGKVLLKTEIGSTRIIDMPAGELFPRIC